MVGVDREISGPAVDISVGRDIVAPRLQMSKLAGEYEVIKLSGNILNLLKYMTEMSFSFLNVESIRRCEGYAVIKKGKLDDFFKNCVLPKLVGMSCYIEGNQKIISRVVSLVVMSTDYEELKKRSPNNGGRTKTIIRVSEDIQQPELYTILWKLQSNVVCFKDLEAVWDSLCRKYGIVTEFLFGVKIPPINKIPLGYPADIVFPISLEEAVVLSEFFSTLILVSRLDTQLHEYALLSGLINTRKIRCKVGTALYEIVKYEGVDSLIESVDIYNRLLLRARGVSLEEKMDNIEKITDLILKSPKGKKSKVLKSLYAIM
ncbi:hypothetical protein DRP04_11460 [Archaeoglobales archaeon]|nr:MAG: hypothetical protein DRP04_11460 [Archaeoglobales archaeon]